MAERREENRWSGVLTPGSWRLGTRFAVLFALVATVVVVLIGTLAYNTAAGLIRADARQEFEATVEDLSAELVRLAASDRAVSEQTFAFLSSSYFEVQVVWPDGSRTFLVRDPHDIRLLPLAQQDLEIAARAEAGVSAQREQRVGGQDYRVAAVSLGGGQGAVQVVQRLSPVEGLLSRLAQQMVWVGLFVLLAAGGAGWLVGHRLTGRLVQLTEAAEYVSSTGRLDPVTPDREAAGRDEVGRLGQAFNAMLARLVRSKEEQRRLVQNAAHELRTPLTSLRTNASVMRRIDRLPPDAQERLIDDVQGETRELTDLVNELVALATGEHEDEPVRMVVLGETAERVAARTRRRTGRDIVVDADDSAVWGRPNALERAMANPVENAAKFDPQGRDPIEIVVRRGLVEVRDRGPGIDPGELGHVFERFFRASVARGLPGSGLGLSMVRDIAEAHGGRVFARNREGGGVVIGFQIPEAAEGEQDASAAAEGRNRPQRWARPQDPRRPGA